VKKDIHTGASLTGNII